MWDSREKERERERENDDKRRYIIQRENTRIARRLKIDVELNWF